MPAFFDDWDALLRPRRIALVGASEQSQFANMIVSNLAQLNYPGEVYFVNPRRETVFGQTCYASLSALPHPVECVVSGIPAEQVPAMVREAIGCGVRAFVVYAGGFGEAGEAGRARQEEIRRLCQDARAGMIGPNCLGLFNVKDRVGFYGDPPPPAFISGPVAIVAQSGSVGNLLMHLGREIGFTYVVTTGNEAVLTAEDLIEYYLDDPDTRVILAFLEGLREPRRFVALAQRALTMGKPIIALKIGRSDVGVRMARGHTAALAGSGRVIEAVFRQAGVVQVHDFDEMAATVELFVHSGRRPKGEHAAIVGISGGETGLIADIAESVGLALPELSPETVAAVRDAMGVPELVSVLNPFDLGLGHGKLPDRNFNGIVAIGRDPGIDIVVVNQDIYPFIDDKLMAYRRSVIDIVVRCAAALDKPVTLISPLSAGLHPELVARLHDAGVGAIQGAREGLQAIQHLGQYALRRQNARGLQRGTLEESGRSPEREPTTADPTRVRQALGERVDGQHLLGERATQRLLAAYGVSVPRVRLSHSPAEAARAAGEIGFPVVLKIESPDVIHKSDVDGVRLGLETAEQVAESYSALLASVQQHRPSARIEGVLVAEQVPNGVELIVGVQQDAQFGPVVLVGLGGVLAEVLDQVALAVPPLSAEIARQLLTSFPGHQVLAGVRGRAAADIDAAAEALVRIGQLALDGEGLFNELDINPLVVGARGQGCCAVDARLLLPD